MKSVTIYTNADCDSCHEAKAFLDENNIPYIEHDISKDKEAKKDIMKRGYLNKSAPALACALLQFAPSLIVKKPTRILV
jgi:glutaredoxin